VKVAVPQSGGRLQVVSSSVSATEQQSAGSAEASVYVPPPSWDLQSTQETKCQSALAEAALNGKSTVLISHIGQIPPTEWAPRCRGIGPPSDTISNFIFQRGHLPSRSQTTLEHSKIMLRRRRLRETHRGMNWLAGHSHGKLALHRANSNMTLRVN